MVLVVHAANGISTKDCPYFQSTRGGSTENSQDFGSVCLNDGTEPAWSGKLLKKEDEGNFKCACCGIELYASATKFDSHTGWPSFWDAHDNVGYRMDYSGGMARTELYCKKCGAHLGHLFMDGPPPTGERHCINSVCLSFQPASSSSTSGTVTVTAKDAGAKSPVARALPNAWNEQPWAVPSSPWAVPSSPSISPAIAWPVPSSPSISPAAIESPWALPAGNPWALPSSTTYTNTAAAAAAAFPASFQWPPVVPAAGQANPWPSAGQTNAWGSQTPTWNSPSAYMAPQAGAWTPAQAGAWIAPQAGAWMPAQAKPWMPPMTFSSAPSVFGSSSYSALPSSPYSTFNAFPSPWIGW